MPVTLDQIEALFQAENLAYRREGNRFVTGFETGRFRDERGRAGIVIVVRLEEKGRHLEIAAPGIYRSRDCPHPAALFQVLLDITLRTKLIRFEHDPDDGEIRCGIEFPIEDGMLTAKQFRRMLECLAESVDRWHPVIVRAAATGETRLDLPRPAAAAAAVH